MEIFFSCFDTLVASPKLCNLHAFFLSNSIVIYNFPLITSFLLLLIFTFLLSSFTEKDLVMGVDFIFLVLGLPEEV